MSKTLPSTYPDTGPGEFMAAQTIQANDWDNITQCQHHLYQRIGARSNIYISGDDPYETTSTSYTTVDDNDADHPLTLHQGVIRLTREMIESSAVKHELVLVCVGKDIVVEASVYAPDSGVTTTLTTFTATRVSTTVDRFEGSVLLTKAQADESGVSGSDPRVLLVSIKVKANATSAALYQAYIYESYITAAELPDGT